MDKTVHGGWQGGRGKDLPKGGFSSLSVAPVAKADDAPPPSHFDGRVGCPLPPPPAPPPPTLPSIVVVAEDPQRDRRQGGS